MNREALLNGYKSLLSTLYAPEYYYDRINTFLKTTIRQPGASLSGAIPRLSQEPVAHRHPVPGQVRVLEAHYKNSPDQAEALPVAVELAILGRHFQLVAKRALQAKDAWATSLWRTPPLPCEA
jgi:hypothetical protein